MEKEQKNIINMKKNLLFLIPLFIFLAGISLFFVRDEKNNIISPLGEIPKLIEKPLEKYSFENLKKRDFKPSEITIGKILKDEDNFISYVFYFNVDKSKVSGLINLPKKGGTFPIIVMFRGFVDQKIYTIGEGTRRSGEVFAANNFITLSPDFLGYGDSDPPSENSIEERFQTYTAALTLLSSIENLNKALEKIEGNLVRADTQKIGIWGHSNGGQIALSVLEISGKNYPAVLWAPVSKPFPYSILYYTDDFDDHGKALRKAVANFEKDYDIEKYSLTNFLNWVEAPVQIHQGGSDEAVPQKWSDQLLDALKKLNKDINYFTYPGNDHNLMPDAWSLAVSRSISFYRENFKSLEK